MTRRRAPHLTADDVCPSPLCGRPLAECPCSFCHGTPVGNAATWLDGVPRPAAACPRCGKTTPYSEGRQGPEAA